MLVIIQVHLNITLMLTARCSFWIPHPKPCTPFSSPPHIWHAMWGVMPCNVVGTVGTNCWSYSSQSISAEDEASFSSYRLQPPSGFSDSCELSEAECARDTTMHLDKLLAKIGSCAWHHQSSCSLRLSCNTLQPVQVTYCSMKRYHDCDKELCKDFEGSFISIL
jgi:hypothetical protein